MEKNKYLLFDYVISVASDYKDAIKFINQMTDEEYRKAKNTFEYITENDIESSGNFDLVRCEKMKAIMNEVYEACMLRVADVFS